MTRLLAVLACLWGCQAAAQTYCNNRDLVTHKLRQQHHERFEGGGKQNSQFIFEVWVSLKKGTWTILRTGKDGRSCVMASGTNWRPRVLGVPG